MASNKSVILRFSGDMVKLLTEANYLGLRRTDRAKDKLTGSWEFQSYKILRSTKCYQEQALHKCFRGTLRYD